MLFNINNDCKDKSGIYKIKNIYNDKIYIGSAVDLNGRYRNHKSDLINNKHSNNYLQNSWNKYGQNNFSFELVELVDNKEDLLEREQYWIDLLNACDKNIGYNICSQAGNTFGKKSTKDTIFKLKYQNPKSIEIIQCDLDGNFIKLWISSRDITRQINYDCSSIIKCCKHKISFAYGYLWFYKDEYYDKNFNLKYFVELAKSNTTFKILDFKVEQYTKNNIYIKTWNNVREISNSLNISEKGILRCCENSIKFHSYKNYIWKMIC